VRTIPKQTSFQKEITEGEKGLAELLNAALKLLDTILQVGNGVLFSRVIRFLCRT
jgi:hypothetical protein